MRWNDKVKAAVNRNEAAWKVVLGARDEEAKERCMEDKIDERERLKGVLLEQKGGK